MSPERRDALLAAIAKARGWIEGIRLGRFASFAEIAEHEAQGERHIRLLAPLALLSPRIIAAIVNATAPTDLTVTGLANAPSTKPAMSPERRDALLAAIAKARGWIEGIRLGRFASFAEIAEHEAQGERHIRLLAPLALLSPRIIAAIVNATAPTDLTVTGLAKALPYSWAEQERRIGLPL